MEYNCRLYDYPDGQHVTFYKKTISRDKRTNIELEKGTDNNFKKTYKNEYRTEEDEKRCMEVSLSATKNRIYNIVRSNTWDWFFTLTFDRTRTDSSEYNLIVKRLNVFLNNIQKRKCPGMKYLIVPELHEDKTHYHFHGLFSNVDSLRFAYSGHDDKSGNPVYNVKDWTWGFTTATRIKDSARASSYITKYITKNNENVIKEKNRYYCSRNIDRAPAELFLKDEEDFQITYADRITYCKSVKIPAAHQRCNYYELSD